MATTKRRTSTAIDKFSLRDAPGHLLRRCHQRSEELFATRVGKDGPTRQQVALLVTACQHPEASQAELVQRTGIDKNTLTQMIKRLVARGLLERQRTPHDARTNQITATAAAVRLLEAVLPDVRHVQDDILEPLPKELRPVFQHCLRLIAGLDD
jgi:MarR family transcriptional regulator, lower aerobic nicotinate degradation pathway regulator